MRVRRLTLGICAAMAAAVLGGCSGSASTSTTAAATAAETTAQAAQTETAAETETESQAEMGETMKKIKESGKIIMGVNATYAPFEFHYTDENGKDQLAGFDIELGKYIADELGVELVIEDMDFNGLLPALTTGKVDFLPGLAATEERRENAGFTEPYHKSMHFLVVRKDEADKYPADTDLAGAVVGVLKGSVQNQTFPNYYPNAEMKELGKISDLIMSVKTGKVDAILLDQTPAKLTVQANEDLSLCGVQYSLPVEEDPGSSILVRKGNEDLEEALNEILAKVVEDGTLQQWEDDAIAMMDADSLND
jgi:polar amino acid transport system substrate-binding protein